MNWFKRSANRKERDIMRFIKNFANRVRKRSKRKFMSKLSGFLSAVFVSSITAISASADEKNKTASSTDITSNALLGNVLSLLSTGVGLAGGILIVWGAVQTGLAVKDQQGANMEKGILTIVAGAIVVAAAVWFNVSYL